MGLCDAAGSHGEESGIPAICDGELQGSHNGHVCDYQGIEMTHSDLMWLAGFLEGEGCFHIRNGKSLSPVIRAVSTDRDVLLKTAILMGSKLSEAKRKTVTGKTVYSTWLGGDASIALMQKLRPYMGCRRAAKIDEILLLAFSRQGVAFGERQGVAKLSNDAVEEIRSTKMSFGMQSKLARKFGVSQACIWYVIKGRSWKHLLKAS